MEILQRVFLVGVSMAIISLLFTVYFAFSFVTQGKRLKKVQSIKSKSKRKKKKLLNDMALLHGKKKKSIRNSVSFLILSLVFGGISYYVTYYQATNLSVGDTQNISDGFYYLRDLKTELEAIQAGTANEETGNQTITFIVTSLAGYSVKTANELNTIEGQSVLNRYYSGMSELGINVSRRASHLYSNPEEVTESLEDLEKVVVYQKKALVFFKVDESVLQAEK